jgi:5-formyltetrahydrofolate cyclo-ligase
MPERSSAMRETKRALRQIVVERRAAMGASARTEASRRILERVLALPEFQRARGVHCFLSFPEEVDTAPIFLACAAAGKATFIPYQIRADRRLGCVRWKPGEPLAEGPFGVPEPPPEQRKDTDLDAIDLVLTPGAAFDRNAQRLGYGLGYYDGFLRSLADRHGPEGWTVAPGTENGRIGRPPAIALAFGVQVVDTVPVEPWDIRLTGVVTESETIRPTLAP